MEEPRAAAIGANIDSVEEKFGPAIPHIDRYAKIFLLSVWE